MKYIRKVCGCVNVVVREFSLCYTRNELEGFTPVTHLVYEIFRACANHGMGDLNYTSIHKWIEDNQRK